MHYYLVHVEAYSAPYTYAYDSVVPVGSIVKVEGRWSREVRTGKVLSEVDVNTLNPGIEYKHIVQVEAPPRPLASFSTEELEAELELRKVESKADEFGISLATFLDIKSQVLAGVA